MNIQKGKVESVNGTSVQVKLNDETKQFTGNNFKVGETAVIRDGKLKHQTNS